MECMEKHCSCSKISKEAFPLVSICSHLIALHWGCVLSLLKRTYPGMSKGASLEVTIYPPGALSALCAMKMLFKKQHFFLLTHTLSCNIRTKVKDQFICFLYGNDSLWFVQRPYYCTVGLLWCSVRNQHYHEEVKGGGLSEEQHRGSANNTSGCSQVRQYFL